MRRQSIRRTGDIKFRVNQGASNPFLSLVLYGSDYIQPFAEIEIDTRPANISPRTRVSCRPKYASKGRTNGIPKFQGVEQEVSATVDSHKNKEVRVDAGLGLILKRLGK